MKNVTPFISRSAFRSMADHIYAETISFDPKAVKEGEIVFVDAGSVADFFTKAHPRIGAPYKILTCDAGMVIGSAEVAFIDDKIIRWFATNTAASHPKLTPIPVGFDDSHDIIKELRRTDVAKADAMSEVSNGKTSEELAKLQSCKFAVVSESFAAGMVPDLQGIWQTVALGVVPVLKKNPLMEYFVTLGMPALFVHDINDFETMSPEMIATKYAEIMSVCGPIADNLVMYHYWQGIVRVPEDKRDEALVCVAINHTFRQFYERDFKEGHERLAYDLRRPLIVIGSFIKKVDKRPTWQKLMMFRTPILSNIERVMLIDADIYIKDTRENPFDLVPSGQWGLAPNNAFKLPTLAVSDLTLYAQCPPENRPSFVMNCGFFIVSQKTHRKIMECVFENYGEQICDEQGPFCYHLINEYKGVVLPFRFNNIVGSYMDTYGYSMTTVMNLYAQSSFFHFAGKANRKIFTIVRFFREHPFLYSIAAFPPVLFALDSVTKIVKKAKGI